MENIIADIRAALEAGADEKTRSTSQNYFKEKIRYYGVRIPVVNKISKDFFAKVQSVPKSEIFSFARNCGNPIFWKNRLSLVIGRIIFVNVTSGKILILSRDGWLLA